MPLSEVTNGKTSFETIIAIIAIIAEGSGLASKRQNASRELEILQ